MTKSSFISHTCSLLEPQCLLLFTSHQVATPLLETLEILETPPCDTSASLTQCLCNSSICGPKHQQLEPLNKSKRASITLWMLSSRVSSRWPKAPKHGASVWKCDEQLVRTCKSWIQWASDGFGREVAAHKQAFHVVVSLSALMLGETLRPSMGKWNNTFNHMKSSAQDYFCTYFLSLPLIDLQPLTLSFSHCNFILFPSFAHTDCTCKWALL